MLHHTAHCAEKVVSTCLCGVSASAGSGSAERVGRGEVGGVTCRVLCTWWLLGLALNYSHLAEGWFLARKATWALSGCMATDSAGYYMLVNNWVW